MRAAENSDLILEAARPGAGEPMRKEAGGDARLFPPLLLQYWHTVVRWRWILLTIIGTSIIVGVTATLLTAPLYTAYSQIQISREQKIISSVETLETTTSNKDTDFYGTQYALLKATSLAERVAKALNLAERNDFFEAHGESRPDARAARSRRAVGLLLGNVAIDPIRNSILVNIRYTSRSPQLSAQIANAWAREFINANVDREFASTADARRFLENRLVNLRDRVSQSERDAAAYASNKNIITLDSVRDVEGKTQLGRTLVSSDLEVLNQALAAARAERISAESAMKTAGRTAPEVLSDEVISTLRARRAEAATQYAQVSAQFKPTYPAAMALERQVRSLDAAIAKQVEEINGAARQSYVRASAREQVLAAKLRETKRDLNQQNRDKIQFDIYQREADTNRQLYDALLQRYKEIGVAGTVGASNIAIVEIAKVPVTPSAPNLTENLLLALLGGIGLAALTVFALEQVDEGIRSPSDVNNLLRLPLLGNVPLVREPPIAALADPRSPLSEAYFSIRSTLAFATNRGLPRSIAVTSSQPEEGKSTTSFAMGVIIGRTGKSVLLVDGDMRSPSVHRLVGAANDAGLSNLLAGEDMFEPLLVQTEYRGLSILAAGPPPPSSAELLSSDRIDQIMEKLLKRFDQVIIDAPPVLGLADAPLLCRASEGCIFVIEPAKAAVRNIRAAIRRLEQVGCHIFGIVIEKIDPKAHNFEFDSGYGYGYGYGNEAEGDARH